MEGEKRRMFGLGQMAGDWVGWLGGWEGEMEGRGKRRGKGKGKETDCRASWITSPLLFPLVLMIFMDYISWESHVVSSLQIENRPAGRLRFRLP